MGCQLLMAISSDKFLNMIHRANDIMTGTYGNALSITPYAPCKICWAHARDIADGDYGGNATKFVSCSNGGCVMSGQIYPLGVWEVLMATNEPPKPSLASMPLKAAHGVWDTTINKSTELPQYAWIVISPTMKSALRLDNQTYVRDAGGWSVAFKFENGELISDSKIILRNEKPLVKCSYEDYKRDNGKFAK